MYKNRTGVAVWMIGLFILAGAARAGEITRNQSGQSQARSSSRSDGRSSRDGNHDGTAPLGVLLDEAAAESATQKAPTSRGFRFSMPGGGMGFSFGFSDAAPAGAMVGTADEAPASGSDDEKPRAWLGVQLVDLSDALATQLGLTDHGATVVNVAQGSPAQAADLRQHDVIVRLNGREVAGVESVREAVAGMKPGDSITLDVIRGGQTLTLTAKLGEFKSGFDWVYDSAPDASFQEDLNFHGHLLRQKDDGTWQFDDLGELDVLKDLPEDIRKALPGHRGFYSQVWVDNDQTRTRVESTTDGTRIVVEENADGRITVQRIDAAGATTESTFANRKELADADEEAASLLERQPVQIFRDGAGQGFGYISGDWPQQVEAWREQMAEQLESAQEALRRTMEQFHDRSAAGGWQGLIPPDGDLKDHRFGPFFGPGRFSETAPELRKPTHSFQVMPDGAIEARIRKGDTEVVRQFTSEDDLARRAPDLHKKFTAVEKNE